MKVSYIKRDIWNRTSIILMFLFFFSANAFWGYRLFWDDVVPAILSIVIIALIFIHMLSKNSTILLNAFVISMTFYAVVVLSSGFDLKAIIYYAVCVAFLLNKDLYKHKDLLKVFYFATFVFAIGTLFNYFFRELHGSLVLPFFKSSSNYLRMEAISRSSTVCPGFVSQTGVNSGFLAYGIGYLFCSYSVNKSNKLRLYALFALLLFCMVLTNKRAHFLFLFVALVLVFYYSGDRGKRAKRFFTIVLVGSVALIVMYYLIMNVDVGVFGKLQSTIIALFNDEDVTSGRVGLYEKALDLFFEHPIFGIGWEEFYANTVNAAGMHLATHNIYLQLLCETGIIGFSIFAFFFIYSFKTAIEIVTTAQSDSDKIASRFCLFMQSFFLLYGLTGNPLYDVPYYMPYFLICAYTISMKYGYRNCINCD